MKYMKNMKGKYDALAVNEVAMDDVGLCNAVYAVDQAKPGSDVVGACLHANDRAYSSASVANSLALIPACYKRSQTKTFSTFMPFMFFVVKINTIQP